MTEPRTPKQIIEAIIANLEMVADATYKKYEHSHHEPAKDMYYANYLTYNHSINLIKTEAKELLK